jgi:hypothetical protein
MEIEYSPGKQIEDAKIVIKNVLQMDIGDEMKMKIIDVMLWNITGAFGKLNTKLISEGALDCPIELLRHEHVYTKKSLISRIMNGNEDIENIFQNVIACVVSKTEHKILHSEGKGAEGLDRYEKAGIKVFILDDNIAHRNLPELFKREFMSLPNKERNLILKKYPLVELFSKESIN